MSLADGNNCGLRAQYSWYEVAATDITYTRHTESSVIEIGLGESSV